MILTAPQQTISDDPARFRVVVAGRRFGKTYLAINELAKFARFPNSKCLYIATTFRQAKTVIWEDLKNIMYGKNWVKRTNESDLSLLLINGSTITLRSSENKDALRGGKYSFIALDEFADMHIDTWLSVLRPTLSDTGGHALFIGSPKGRNHFYDLWIQGSSLEDWSSHQYTTIQGGQVPAEEIEAAKRDLDSRRFEQEYEAAFVDNNQIVFYSFSEKNMVTKTILPNDRTPLHIGMDFNISPMSAVVAQKDKDDIHVFDEIEIWGSNTYEMVKEIRNRYGNQRQMYVYPDASGASRSTNSQGISDHIILQNNGFKLVTKNINPPVAEAIASVNSRLCSHTGEIHLTIDPKCKSLRECLIKHSYKEGTKIPDKTTGYDHMTDALRYLVHGIVPMGINITERHSPKRMSAGRML
tara:strand:+ start:3137 stop:4375 length:1239 start_codon:yes stop_codon:yes gene_type:complete